MENCRMNMDVGRDGGYCYYVLNNKLDILLLTNFENTIKKLQTDFPKQSHMPNGQKHEHFFVFCRMQQSVAAFTRYIKLLE